MYDSDILLVPLPTGLQGMGAEDGRELGLVAWKRRVTIEGWQALLLSIWQPIRHVYYT
jgi:hypothetical protein